MGVGRFGSVRVRGVFGDEVDLLQQLNRGDLLEMLCECEGVSVRV